MAVINISNCLKYMIQLKAQQFKVTRRKKVFKKIKKNLKRNTEQKKSIHQQQLYHP